MGQQLYELKTRFYKKQGRREALLNFHGGENMEEIMRLTRKLQKIKGDDPISRTKKAALMRAIFELQQKMGIS